MKKRGRLIKKRYGWLVVITLLIWLLIFLMIIFVDPENVRDMILKQSFILPGILIYTGFFLLLSILTLSSKRALLWASVLLVVIYLRLWGLGNYLNLLLLIGIAGSIEVYFR